MWRPMSAGSDPFWLPRNWLAPEGAFAKIDYYHDLDNRGCWCKPEILQPCPSCSLDDRDVDCWRCEGRGLVDQYDNDAPVIIVHRYDDERRL